MLLLLQPEFLNGERRMSRSTFAVLFYANRSKEKTESFPSWDVSQLMERSRSSVASGAYHYRYGTLRATVPGGRSREALDLNRDLDNIKAQIIKHYQHLSDREAFVTAEMVRNAYQGLGTEYETLLGAFDKDNADF